MSATRRPLRRAWGIALAVLGAGVGPSPGAAQEASLEAVAAQVARDWSAGNADGIASLLSSGGVALRLLDQGEPAAGVRQARAAIAELVARRGAARPVRVEDLGGAPRRGFVELRWEVAEPGSREGLRYVVFLGFTAEADGWRINEVRVLR